MSPGFTEVTEVTFTGTWHYANPCIVTTKVETKKERIERIAKARMLASQKTFNLHTPTIHKIINRCKPHHRIKY